MSQDGASRAATRTKSIQLYMQAADCEGRGEIGKGAKGGYANRDLNAV